MEPTEKRRGPYKCEAMALVPPPGHLGGSDHHRACIYMQMGVLNRYRSAVAQLKKTLWSGTADSASMSSFLSEIESIEEDAEGWEP